MACHAGQADPVQPEALDRKLWNRFSLGSLLPSFSLPSFSGCFSFFFQTRTRRTRRTRTGLDELNSYIPVIFLYSLDGLVIDTLFFIGWWTANGVDEQEAPYSWPITDAMIDAAEASPSAETRDTVPLTPFRSFLPSFTEFFFFSSYISIGFD